MPFALVSKEHPLLLPLCLSSPIYPGLQIPSLRLCYGKVGELQLVSKLGSGRTSEHLHTLTILNYAVRKSRV